MASGTWTGAASDSLWSNPNNWSDNTLPDVSYQSVTFNDGAKVVLDSDLTFGGYYINVNGDVSLSSNEYTINGVSDTGLIVKENASLTLENTTLALEYVSNKSNITLENSHISVKDGNNTNWFMGNITFSSDETSSSGSSITITDDGGAANMLGTISNFGKYDKIIVYKDGSVNNISVVENNDGTYSLLETLPSYGDGYTRVLSSKMTFADGLKYSDFKTYQNSNGDYVFEYDPSLVCFLAGSMIRTSEGDVAVEDIQIGDEVLAFDWKNNKEVTKPVVWVGKARAVVRPELHDDEAGWPVRILKDAIADGVPYKDMLITAEHCLFFRDRFVPVRMLVNGVSIFYDKSITSYDYYHVETEQHSVITADGMLTESYLDTGNRSSFRQEGKVATLRGAVKNWADDAGAPLGVDRSFVEPLFRALEWRENSVVGCQVTAEPVETTTDPDLHLVTQTGAVIRPMRKTAQNYSFMLPPNTDSVRIISRASRPSDVIGPFVDDRRHMGVAVADVQLQCAKQHFDITSHLQEEKPAGWYDTDWTDCAWTNGDAELPLGNHLTHGKMGILSMTIRAAGPYLLNTHQATDTKKQSA